MNALAKDRHSDQPPIEQCVLICGDRIRFTKTGRERFAERFARAGINIDSVCSIAQLREALAGSFDAHMAAFAERIGAGEGDRLERQFLQALALGDEAERLRIGKILDRRNHLGLQVLTGGPTANAQ